ncbi:hypothetical protein [Nostoc sp.]|uniref:hypothetical protein n=1 Tax=Nostoc sp. TaxID=1180 RepID=UPI002FFAFC38
MLATTEVNAFTDSPRNLTVPASKQPTAREFQLLPTGARLKEGHLYKKNLAWQGVQDST